MVGGVCVTEGTCMAWGVWFEGNAWLEGVCMAGAMHGWRYARLREVCVAEGAHVAGGGMHKLPVWLTSGQYASYWNAVLLCNSFMAETRNLKERHANCFLLFDNVMLK